MQQHNTIRLLLEGFICPTRKSQVSMSESVSHIISHKHCCSLSSTILSSRKVSLLPKTSQESTVIPNSPANYYYIFRIMHNTDHYLHLLIFKTPHTISLDIVNSRTTGTLIISKISPPFNCASILYYLVCP